MNKLAIAALLGAVSAHGHGHRGNKGHHGHHAKEFGKGHQNDAKMMEEIVAGILEGALDAEGFDDINSCIKDVEHVYSDAKTAVADFEKKDVQDIIEGIKTVADLLKTIKTGMQDCSHLKADWEKLAKMVAIFDSPTSFAYHVGKDLIVNGVQIYHEIDTAVSDYKEQKWGDFGYNIGEAAAKTLLGAEEAQLEMAKENEKMRAAEIFQGVLAAFGGKFDLYALLICIYDEDQALLFFDIAYQALAKALEEVKEGDTQDAIGDAIGGVIGIVGGLQQFKQGLPACEAIDTTTFNYEGMEKCTDIALHPSKYIKVMGEDILINSKSLIQHSKLAVAAYEAGDFVKFGEMVGEIMQLATEEPQEEAVEAATPDVNRQMITEFAQGFLKGTKVGEFNFTNLLICVYEADQAALILYQAVEILEEAYKDKDPTEAIGGVIAAIAFVQQLKQSIPVCEAVDQTKMDWTHFDHIVETLEDPKDHMAQIEKDIVFNGVTITEDLGEALEAFRAGDFEKFGEKLGQTVYVASEGNNLFLY